MNKQKSLSEIIFQKMLKNEPFKQILLDGIKIPSFVDSGMPQVWAGLIQYSDDTNFNLLLENKAYPNEKSKLVLQIFFHYNCLEKRREELSQKMDTVISFLEKTLEGRAAIVKDIEEYFKYYGKSIIEPDVYPFIEPIYQKYAEDKNKIYYLEIVNLLKFCNTLPKPLLELKSFNNMILPLLPKIVDTHYWNKVKKIKFYNSDNQESWINFCKEYQKNFKSEFSNEAIKKIKP